ncbi:acyltransferase, partial [Shigella flexneri]|nr:acyltransferase [Shigella flexneri]
TPLVGVVMAAGMVLVFSTFVERQLRTLARRTGTGRALRSSITALTRTGTVVVVLLHGLVLMELMRLGVEDNLAKFTVALGLSWAVGLALLATPLSRALTGVPQQWHAIGPASTGARP